MKYNILRNKYYKVYYDGEHIRWHDSDRGICIYSLLESRYILKYIKKQIYLDKFNDIWSNSEYDIKSINY